MANLAGHCVAFLSCDEGEVVPPVCGTPIFWGLLDSCESTVDAYLADPTVSSLEIHVHDSQRDFVVDLLAQTLRQRVLAQCEGRA